MNTNYQYLFNILNKLKIKSKYHRNLLNKFSNSFRFYEHFFNKNNDFMSGGGEIEIKKGAIFCDVKITDNGVYLVCKSFHRSCKHFQIKLDECLVFQKLTEQEKVLLSVMDHLSEK
jgi:hypothetical protein